MKGQFIKLLGSLGSSQVFEGRVQRSAASSLVSANLQLALASLLTAI